MTYRDALFPAPKKATDRVAAPPTRAGRPTAWFVGDEQIGSLGAVIQTGGCINDEAELDFAEAMEDVQHGTYRPDTATEELEIDGMWGAVVQSSQGLLSHHLHDPELRTGPVSPTTTGPPTSDLPAPVTSEGSRCSTLAARSVRHPTWAMCRTRVRRGH